MGEITDALRRARLERERRRAQDSEGAAHLPTGNAGPRTDVLEQPADGAEPRDMEPPLPLETVDASYDETASCREIPRSKDGFWTARAVVVDPRGVVAECFRHFALRVRGSLEQRKTSSVLITSAVRNEGKTLTACNLALALASMAAGRRIALVDLDLRNPEVARGMGVEASVPFERVLARAVSLRSACTRTDLPSLDLYLAEKPVPQAHEVLAAPVLATVLGELTRRYATVVCCGPPVLPVPDVPLILPHVGSCVAVVRAGTTRRSTFRDMLELLPPEKLIGSFLNDAHLSQRTTKARYYPVGSDAPEAL